MRGFGFCKGPTRDLSLMHVDLHLPRNLSLMEGELDTLYILHVYTYVYLECTQYTHLTTVTATSTFPCGAFGCYILLIKCYLN